MGSPEALSKIKPLIVPVWLNEITALNIISESRKKRFILNWIEYLSENGKIINNPEWPDQNNMQMKIKCDLIPFNTQA